MKTRYDRTVYGDGAFWIVGHGRPPVQQEWRQEWNGEFRVRPFKTPDQALEAASTLVNLGISLLQDGIPQAPPEECDRYINHGEHEIAHALHDPKLKEEGGRFFLQPKVKEVALDRLSVPIYTGITFAYLPANPQTRSLHELLTTIEGPGEDMSDSDRLQAVAIHSILDAKDEDILRIIATLARRRL